MTACSFFLGKLTALGVLCFFALLFVAYIHVHVHVLMTDEKEGRKKHARSNKQEDKATQHTQGTFPKKNELPKVGLESTTLYTLARMYIVHACACKYTCSCF